MITPIPLPMIDQDHCTGCEDCVEVCHVGALALQDARARLADPEACDYCTDCEAVCPAGAIRCPFEVVFEDLSTLNWLETSRGMVT